MQGLFYEYYFVKHTKIKRWWLECVRRMYVHWYCKSIFHTYVVGRSKDSSAVAYKCLTCGKGVLFDDVVWIAIEFKDGDRTDKFVMDKLKQIGFVNKTFRA